MITNDFQVLPVGRLTVLAEQQAGIWRDWRADVAEPISRAISSGRPVVYVECGGFENCQAEDLRRRVGGNPLLGIVDDADHTLLIPAFAGGCVGTEICDVVPVTLGTLTLENVSRALAVHEEKFGPATLVLDSVDFARPWAGMDAECQDPHTLSTAILHLSPQQVCEWRAMDLHRLAASRPNVPTIAIARSREVAESLSEVPRYV